MRHESQTLSLTPACADQAWLSLWIDNDSVAERRNIAGAQQHKHEEQPCTVQGCKQQATHDRSLPPVKTYLVLQGTCVLLLDSREIWAVYSYSREGIKHYSSHGTYAHINPCVFHILV